MRRKRRIFQHSNTQGYPLRDHIDLQHPLVELADVIDWAAIDRGATEPFQPGPGRPILRPRLVAGLLYLQHAFNLSDEQVVAGWLENPYWQVFTGETHLQTEPPIDPSSLSR
jgi:IS5 family transposase